MTSIFKPYNGEGIKALPYLKKDSFIEKVYNAKFKEVPSDFSPLSESEIEKINNDPDSSSKMPQQESGIRPSCPIPYQLYVDGKLSGDKKNFELTMTSLSEVFSSKTAGAPFNVYFPGRFDLPKEKNEQVGSRSYAVTAGESLTDSWPVKAFEKGVYHVRTYGPNGFFREFKGNIEDPAIEIVCEYEGKKSLMKKLSGNIALKLTNLNPSKSYTIEVKDNAYKNKAIKKVLAGGVDNTCKIILDLNKSFNWYDFSIHIQEAENFKRRYAGHVETGKESFTDPVMGRTLV